MMELAGDKYGIHRVIDPKEVLPQPALKVNNDMSVFYESELLIDVDLLNIDAASFTQIKQQAGNDLQKISSLILEIVNQQGKMKNPVTGSGGMLIGTVEKIGILHPAINDLKVGDRIASLVSLSLTPLYIEEILHIKPEIDQVKIKGKAILFESGLYAKLPIDLPDALSLAVLDVCGAPAQTERLVCAGDIVVIIGAGGKSGILCCYEAKKQAGFHGKIIGIELDPNKQQQLKNLELCDEILALDATDTVACLKAISEYTNGNMADVVINNVNIPNSEMATILMCRDRGVAYFFSMATSFTKAALGAEGVGKDIDMLIGNGYAKGHAEMALNILRSHKGIRELYQSLYS